MKEIIDLFTGDQQNIELIQSFLLKQKKNFKIESDCAEDNGVENNLHLSIDLELSLYSNRKLWGIIGLLESGQRNQDVRVNNDAQGKYYEWLLSIAKQELERRGQSIDKNPWTSPH